MAAIQTNPLSRLLETKHYKDCVDNKNECENDLLGLSR